MRKTKTLINVTKNMINENIDPIEDDSMEQYKHRPPGLDEDEDKGQEDDCPYFGIMMHSIFLSKPFGINWDLDKIEKFLSKQGYRIITRHYTDEEHDNSETYKVALKYGMELPDQEGSNIRDVFCSEVQDILLNWLSKISLY